LLLFYFDWFNKKIVINIQSLLADGFGTKELLKFLLFCFEKDFLPISPADGFGMLVLNEKKTKKKRRRLGKNIIFTKNC